MLRTQWVLIGGIIAMTSSFGCMTDARPILRTTDGGVVAIPENTNRFPSYHYDNAKEIIEEHAKGRPYEIVQEEEVKVGESIISKTDSDRRATPEIVRPFSDSERSSTSTTTTTETKREYQIRYRFVDREAKGSDNDSANSLEGRATTIGSPVTKNSGKSGNTILGPVQPIEQTGGTDPRR